MEIDSNNIIARYQVRVGGLKSLKLKPVDVKRKIHKLRSGERCLFDVGLTSSYQVLSFDDDIKKQY